jgi:hypothetical protein
LSPKKCAGDTLRSNLLATCSACTNERTPRVAPVAMFDPAQVGKKVSTHLGEQLAVIVSLPRQEDALVDRCQHCFRSGLLRR